MPHLVARGMDNRGVINIDDLLRVSIHDELAQIIHVCSPHNNRILSKAQNPSGLVLM